MSAINFQLPESAMRHVKRSDLPSLTVSALQAYFSGELENLVFPHVDRRRVPTKEVQYGVSIRLPDDIYKKLKNEKIRRPMARTARCVLLHYMGFDIMDAYE